VQLWVLVRFAEALERRLEGLEPGRVRQVP
jgi:hypothetical protein